MLGIGDFVRGEGIAIKGDVPGHEFHGNQYSSGGGGSGDSGGDGGSSGGGDNASSSNDDEIERAAADKWNKVKTELATAANKHGFEGTPGNASEFYKVVHGKNEYGPTKVTHRVSANRGSGKFSHRLSLEHVTPLGPNSTGQKFGPFNTAEEAFQHAEAKR